MVSPSRGDTTWTGSSSAGMSSRWTTGAGSSGMGAERATVVIDHGNGYVTTYASLQPEVSVLAGDAVDAGSMIGLVGNTSLTEAGLGAHLHFSVAKDGEIIDPAVYLGE